MLDSAVRFDLDRERRIGLPEAVFCAGKPFDTLAGLFARFAIRNAPPVLFTRLDAEVFAKIDPDTAGKYNFDPLSRTAWNAVRPRRPGVCAVVSAGSADAPVVMEAARTLEYLGYEVKKRPGGGVAGLWRIEAALPEINACDAVICAAGLDAALASVLGGLTMRPLFAVPTSIGYGIAQGGETALRSMLASCAPGVAVLNIDNGYSAACALISPGAVRNRRLTLSFCSAMDTTMPDSILAIRIHAGFNASSFTAGLLALTEQTSGTAGAYLRSLFPGLDIGLELKPAWVRGISGWTVKFLTPAETGHGHRHPEDIEAIYAASRLSAGARQRARAVWHELVRAEARVHGTSENEVHLHEVGRLSNILAVGLCAQFLETLELERIAASPIPVSDGEVICAHGTVPYPAPAMFAMMPGVAVRPSSGIGELVTPTGLAMLKGFGAHFGSWPEMQISSAVNVFVPGCTFDNVPNGTRFLLGRPLPQPAE